VQSAGSALGPLASAVVAAALFLFSCGCATAAGWTLGGRYGCEVDGSREEFGPGSLFDVRVDPAGTPGDAPGTPDEAVLARRFLDREMRFGALGELRAAREGELSFRGRGAVHLADDRARGDLDVEVRRRVPGGRLTLGGRLLLQHGSSGGGAGTVASGTAAWRSGRLPFGLELRAAASGEQSWAGADSLRDLFAYRLARPSLELRRPFGWAGGASLRAGLGRKWTHGSALGAYQERWGEAEWHHFGSGRRQYELRARTESRRYLRARTVIPSYDEARLEAAATIPLERRFRLHVAPKLFRAAFAADDSLVYRDHVSGELLVRLESGLRDWRGGTPAGEDSLLDPPDWLVRAGARLGWLRNERVREADHASASFVAGCARESLGGFWLDLSGEVGRRDYRRSSGTGTLVFEGLQISIAGTDYTFVSLSLVGQADLGRKLRLEAFGLYDRELHRAAADDFSLWAFTMALTRDL